tara:strand:- start:826 stop:3294 length:2469 start_codon:yes stop_codon:yes gene_type:complete
MTDIVLSTVQNTDNLSSINDNFDKVEGVINTEIVHTTGGNNVMSQDFDMNSNKILNIPKPVDPTDIVRLQDLPTSFPAKIFTDKGTSFSTLSDLIDGVLPDDSVVDFSKLVLVNTVANNSDTNMGGASYKILTAVAYAVETGNTTPDGETVNGRVIGMDHYVGSGSNYVAKYNMSVGFDRACGTIGDDRILGATHDDQPALQKLFDWAKQNSPIDEGKIQKGYQKTFIHPRSRFYIGSVIDLRNARIDYDFNQSELYTSGAHSAIYWESTLSTLKNVIIEGLTHATRADWMTSGEALVEWGFEEPINYSNGSHANFRHVIIRGGYHCFSMNSVSVTNASFIWASRFEHCYFESPVEYCYYFNAQVETSTTMEYATCHARCTARDSVTIGGFDYYCIAHHISDATNQPETGVDWELYWFKEPTFAPRGDWVTNNQYITNGKGFYFYNVNSLSMLGCSMDGGNNLLDGTVVSYVGQAIHIDRFHLESFNHNVVNTKVPFNIVGDLVFGTLALFTHRFRMPNTTDKAYFIGCDTASSSRFTVTNCLNKTPTPDATTGLVQGQPVWIDGNNTLSLDLGAGVPINAVERLPATSTAQRGITKQIVKPLTSGTSTFSFTPDKRDNGVKFVTGDGAGLTNLTVNLDNYLYHESVDYDTNPQYDSYSFEFFVRASGGTSSLTFTGINGALLIGDTSYPEGVTVKATKISSGSWLLEQVSIEGGIAPVAAWIEYIPAGSYQNGTFTLPDSKTWDDIAELRISAKQSSYHDTRTINFVEGGFVASSRMFLNPYGVDAQGWSRFMLGTAVGTTGELVQQSGSVYVTGASVRYK